MSEEAALLKAIAAHADDDTPRLVYADWLDENKPDRRASPAEGPSARAEFIRVQCRLAAGAFDSPDYPELLEREIDLAAWLNTHDPEPFPDLADLDCDNQFEGGEWGSYRRGFPEVVELEEYEEDAVATVAIIAEALEAAFAKCPARTLRLEDAMVEEVALLAQTPVFARIRGLHLDYLNEGNEDDAVRAIAESPHAAGMRRLYFDFPIGLDGCKALAESQRFAKMESLVLDYPPVDAAALRMLGRARWFRNLRRLHVAGSRRCPSLAGRASTHAAIDVPHSAGAAGNKPRFDSPVRRPASFPRLSHLT